MSCLDCLPVVALTVRAEGGAAVLAQGYRRVLEARDTLQLASRDRLDRASFEGIPKFQLPDDVLEAGVGF